MPSLARNLAVLTSVLRELRDFNGAREALLPAAPQAALDGAIDAVVDALAAGARASEGGDVDGALAAYEACVRRVAESATAQEELRPLAEMLDAELAKISGLDPKMDSVTLRKSLVRVLSLTW